MRLLLTTLNILVFSIFLIGQTYQSAESAEYDPNNNRFLISNGSNILARASDGTLSYFGSGATSYGLEVMGNIAYGISGSSIKGFDLDTEQEVLSISIPGASFLNGLTNDGQGMLYATDFGADRVHKIDVSDIANPTSEILINSLPDTPNGILYDTPNNRLLIVTWNQGLILQYDLATDMLTTLLNVAGTSAIDGIDDDSYGNYFIASWSPNRITRFDLNFENPMTISVPGISSPADIGYAQAIDTLAIPQGNKVDYIGFAIVNDVNEITDNEFGLLVYPNPMTSSSWIQFELAQQSFVKLSLFDMNGKLVQTLLEGEQHQGQHKVVMNGIDLPKGIYSCGLEVNGSRTISTQIVVN